MNIYVYKIIDRDGNIIKDKIEACNKKEVEDYLKQNNYYIINIKKFNFLNRIIIKIFNLRKSKIIKKDLSIFCRHMCFVLESGLTIILSIDIIVKQCENKTLKTELIKIKENLLKGESLSNSMLATKKFPGLLCNMINVGEESGNLSEIMDIMANYYEENWKTIENIKMAMLYPFIVLTSMVGMIIVSLVFVVPNYSNIFKNQYNDLPILTKILINTSNFFISYYLLITIIFFIILIFLKIIWNTYYIKKFRDIILFKIPYVNKFYIKLLNLKFSQSMNIMLKSGVPILKSVTITKDIMNNNISNRVMDKLYDDLKQGISLVDSIKDSKIFIPMILGVLSVGESTGNLTQYLYKIYKYLSFEIKNDINLIEKLVEPVLIIILGLILAFIMIAIMLPIFSISNYV